MRPPAFLRRRPRAEPCPHPEADRRQSAGAGWTCGRCSRETSEPRPGARWREADAAARGASEADAESKVLLLRDALGAIGERMGALLEGRGSSIAFSHCDYVEYRELMAAALPLKEGYLDLRGRLADHAKAVYSGVTSPGERPG